MDYDYDHLGSGVEELRAGIRRLVQDAQASEEVSALRPDQDEPAWLVEACDLEEAVCGFPEAHEVDVVERVRQALDLACRVRALDSRVAPPARRELVALNLEQAVHDECEAQERHMGVTVPMEVRYPELASRVPTP